MNKAKSKKNKQTSQMWGGRFKKDSSEIMKIINASIRFDKKLAFHDIALSKAHSDMLCNNNIISNTENKKIQFNFKIENFKIPLEITNDLIQNLINVKKNDEPPEHMYM